MPTTKNEFFEDFKKIQEELPTIERTKEGHHHKYADIEAVWEGIKKTISDNNFIVIHYPGIEEGREMYITEARHVSGETKVAKMFFREGITEQEKGSAITYYRRYNICSIFNVIIEGEDDDGQGASKNYSQGAERPITEKQLKWMKELCNQKNVDIEAYQNQIGKKFEELYSTEASAIIDKLKSM